MKRSPFLAATVFGIVLSLGSSAWAATPKALTKSYMFNVREMNGLFPSSEDAARAINFSIKRTIHGTKCFAKAVIDSYTVVANPNSVAAPSPDEVVAVATAKLTANCRETAQIGLNRWAQNASLEVFQDIQVGPWPAVSGGN